MVFPDLVDNRKHRLGEVLKALLELSPSPTLDVATAFFNLRGLQALAPALEGLAALRLLLGKEQDQAFLVGERLLKELQEAMSKAQTSAQEIARWRSFLGEERVQVRLYEQAFLHGKAYLVGGVPYLGRVGVVGSSNFTGGGLEDNLELNAILKQESAVEALAAWFEALWQEARDYKPDLLELLERFTEAYTPHEIYIKVLYEALKDQLELGESERSQGEGAQPPPIRLADFQQDGYERAKEILKRYGGVLIADSVGLGKTFIALSLLNDLAYHPRQKALVVVPASLASTWKRRLEDYGIPHRLLTMERLGQGDFSPEAYRKEVGEFGAVVVDESHNFRNPHTNRWKNLFGLVQGEVKVILLTATPVNNSVFDLYHQLRLIAKDREDLLGPLGIPRLRERFQEAEKNPEGLYEVLEALVVRRSRSFIRRNYPEAELDGERIRFPERKLHTVSYSLQAIYGKDFYRRVAGLLEGLHLAPYRLALYRRPWVEDRTREGQPLDSLEGVPQGLGVEFVLQLGRQVALTQILKVLYLKRLESSLEAFRVSMKGLYGFLEAFLEALEGGKLLRPADYRALLAEDEEVALEALAEGLEGLPEDLERERVRKDTEADLKALGALLREMEGRGSREDSKLQALKGLLRGLGGEKVLLFTYFRETARYLYEALEGDYPGPMGLIEGGVGAREREALARAFQEGDLSLLISTDVLSEGHDLQKGKVLINYDLHWNPVRLVQRIGRLDRIGSPHPTIHVYNFFPEEGLEELLGLVQRIQAKVSTIQKTVGLDVSILGEDPVALDFHTLKRLQEEDPGVLEELERESEFALGEFLKQDLWDFMNRLGKERLERIPWGVGTAKRGEAQGFFAAFQNPKTGHHHWLYEEGGVILEGVQAIRKVRSLDPKEPPLPPSGDPTQKVQSLRAWLWRKLQKQEQRLERFQAPQKRVVWWLRALPHGRGEDLLPHFEAHPLEGMVLEELRRLWRGLQGKGEEEVLGELKAFAERYIRPSGRVSLVPDREEDLLCVAWMEVRP